MTQSVVIQVGQCGNQVSGSLSRDLAFIMYIRLAADSGTLH